MKRAPGAELSVECSDFELGGAERRIGLKKILSSKDARHLPLTWIALLGG